MVALLNRLAVFILGASLLATSLSIPARAADPAAADPWLDLLTGELAAHFMAEGDLVLDWARPRPAAPAGAELVIVELPASLAPQMLVRVRLVVPEKSAVETAVFLRAQLWRDGWSPREPSTRGDSLRPTALDVKRFDALRDREGVPAGPNADLVFVRAVPAGRLLTWRDVARRPLVRRGELIEVAASDGALTVTLRAVAMEDAGRGEMVRVRNPESKKEFTAQVVSESRALVRF